MRNILNIRLGLFLTCIILIAWVILFYTLNFYYNGVDYWALMLIGAAIVTFFGLLALPGGISKDGSILESRIRFAVTGCLIIVYLVHFGSIVYDDNLLKEDSGSFAISTISTFSNLLVVVISFYFGSTAAIEIADTVSKKGQSV